MRPGNPLPARANTGELQLETEASIGVLVIGKSTQATHPQFASACDRAVVAVRIASIPMYVLNWQPL
ncbi:hypothetical protein MycrhDRAFT_3457 [Mycolicibacterium rhodesiae JS60]|nr:hypothetical protein MycrhDRAFT_3457 [Mycolicibacterium rhodesiae JS60]